MPRRRAAPSGRRSTLQRAAGERIRRSLGRRTNNRNYLVKAPRTSAAGVQFVPISLDGLVSFSPRRHERVSGHADPLVGDWIREVPAHGWWVVRDAPKRNRASRGGPFKKPAYKMKWQT